MKAPISWLKDFVEINVLPQSLAKKLIEIGFEVNGRQLRMNKKKGYEGTTRPINIMYLI